MGLENRERQRCRSGQEDGEASSGSILLNIMFHAPIGRFQLELMYYFTYFSTVNPSNSCMFLSCRPFVVNITFSTGLMGVEALARRQKKLQHPQDLLKMSY